MPKPRPELLELIMNGKYLEAFKKMENWDTVPLYENDVLVIEVVKVPARKSKKSVYPPRLAIKIRRADAFEGIFIRDVYELRAFLELVKRVDVNVWKTIKGILETNYVELPIEEVTTSVEKITKEIEEVTQS